ncbi:hypothetical protein NFJ02_34g86640 [Pycnococcus provasolii]
MSRHMMRAPEQPLNAHPNALTSPAVSPRRLGRRPAQQKDAEETTQAFLSTPPVSALVSRPGNAAANHKGATKTRLHQTVPARGGSMGEAADALEAFANAMRDAHNAKRRAALLSSKLGHTVGSVSQTTTTTTTTTTTGVARSFARTYLHKPTPTYDTRRLPTNARRRRGLDEAVERVHARSTCTVTLVAARVGTVESRRRGGNATFSGDRVEFEVEHPRHGKVHMKLLYTHFRNATLDDRGGLHTALRLNLDNTLEPYFTRGEFDPRTSSVLLTFADPAEMRAAVASTPRLRAALSASARS